MMDVDTKVRLVREVDSMMWNLGRQIYPVTTLLLQIDYDLYKEFEIQEQWREIHALHKNLENSIKEICSRLTKERDSHHD